jgi:hypothetical protein
MNHPVAGERPDAPEKSTGGVTRGVDGPQELRNYDGATMAIAKDSKLTAMITEDDMSKLKSLSEADDVSASQVVRLLIRAAYTDRFGEKKPKKR